MVPDVGHNPELVAISIILSEWRMPQDMLALIDLDDIKADLKAALDATKSVAWAVGGLDISFNDDTAKGLNTAFQAQIYLIAQVSSGKLVSQQLRASGRYSASKAIVRPIQVKRSDGSGKHVSYVFKTYGVRRIAYWGQRWPLESNQWCWRTRKVSMRAREQVEFLLWLDEVGIAGRLFLYRLTTARTANGIRLITEPVLVD